MGLLDLQLGSVIFLKFNLSEIIISTPNVKITNEMFQVLFFHTISLKSDVYFTHVSHFKCSVATCGYCILNSTAQVAMTHEVLF